MDKAPEFFFGREIAVTQRDKRLKKIQRMQKDLDWLYDTARDKEEKESISFVESVMDNWVDAELKFKEGGDHADE
jgi:t-SNARE complex subunit (syntaxin)